MLNLFFYFLKFPLKIQSCEKSVEDKSSGEQPKLTNYVICFLLFSVIVKILYENCQSTEIVRKLSIFAMLAWFTHSTLESGFLPLCLL